MKTATYRNRVGRLYCPIIENKEEMYVLNTSDEGFCLGCGNTRVCVEPDAEKYECEICGENQVFGLQQLMLMDLVKFEF